MSWEKEKNLDYLLQECRDELSRHRTNEEWDNISKRVCNDLSAKRDKPLFLMYLDKLESDGLIKKNETGHVATYKGLFFRGYKKTKRKENISPNLQLIQTWAIVIGAALAGLYALYQFLQGITCRH